MRQQALYVYSCSVRSSVFRSRKESTAREWRHRTLLAYSYAYTQTHTQIHSHPRQKKRRHKTNAPISPCVQNNIPRQATSALHILPEPAHPRLEPFREGLFQIYIKLSFRCLASIEPGTCGQLWFPYVLHSNQLSYDEGWVIEDPSGPISSGVSLWSDRVESTK